MQNVGAYGQEVSETIESLEVFDLKDGQVRDLCREACGFTYRSSIFNTTERGRFVILRVVYALAPGGEPRLTYADLKRHFEGRETAPNLAETREAVRHIRALKGMLLVAGDPDCQSAGLGSSRIRCSARSSMKSCGHELSPRGFRCPAIPRWKRTRKFQRHGWWRNPDSRGDNGFGHVGISGKHALAIVNRGGATAAEVLALKDQIQQRVEEIWGIKLQPEPVMIGF